MRVKKEFLILGILASTGTLAGIEWLEDHDLSHLEKVSIVKDPEYEHLFADVDFDIDDTPKPEKKPESSKDEIIFISDHTESLEQLFAEVDFDVDDAPAKPKKVEPSKEEIIFVSRGIGHKEPVSETEIALSDPPKETELVQIAEVGPFSPFSISGRAVKMAHMVKKDEKKTASGEMILIRPEDSAQHEFYISSKKVTNREYEAFVQATHHRPPPHWKEGTVPSGLENDPVVNVTYKDAFLYSVWAGKRLPKEAELLLAAKTNLKDCDICEGLGEWTSTPGQGKHGSTRGASHITMGSDLSRITYHKVFMGPEIASPVMDSTTYNNTLGFRVALNQ